MKRTRITDVITKEEAKKSRILLTFSDKRGIF